MSGMGRFNRVLIYIILIFCVLLFLVPAYMVVITSFKSPAQIDLATAWNLPGPWYLQSFADAWEKFAPNIYNSVSLVIPATIISSIMGSLNGYVLAKWKFRGSNILFMFPTAGVMCQRGQACLELMIGRIDMCEHHHHACFAFTHFT